MAPWSPKCKQPAEGLELCALPQHTAGVKNQAGISLWLAVGKMSNQTSTECRRVMLTTTPTAPTRSKGRSCETGTWNRSRTQHPLEDVNASLPTQLTATVVSHIISCVFSSNTGGSDAKINSRQAEVKCEVDLPAPKCERTESRLLGCCCFALCSHSSCAVTFAPEQ